MYQVQDTLDGYASVAASASKRAAMAALRRLCIAHPTRDYRLVRHRGGWVEVIA